MRSEKGMKSLYAAGHCLTEEQYSCSNDINCIKKIAINHVMSTAFAIKNIDKW